jgi:hypothetical protein
MQFGRRRRGIGAMVASITLVASMAWAAPAPATFHEMWIREVYPGFGTQAGSEYIELQMWASGQHRVNGHSIAFYEADGTPLGSETFSADVGSGANQSTILAATTAAASEFGVAADLTIAPGKLDPGGGAVCWASLDCVSWGSFSGGSPPSPAGPPATPAGIPDGMALRRTIAPGCPSLLEATDDRNDSALDFSPVFPAPRPNSSAPTERSCASSGGGAGGPGAGGYGAPPTKLKRRPPNRTTDRTPTFRFSSDEAGSTFQCKLDRKPFRSCRSPFTAKRLSLGQHTFKVRARDASGQLDTSPAVDHFTVVTKH